jgi:hypothetical protein
MIEDFGSYSSTATVRETGQLSDDEHAEGQVSSCAYITRRLVELVDISKRRFNDMPEYRQHCHDRDREQRTVVIILDLKLKVSESKPFLTSSCVSAEMRRSSSRTLNVVGSIPDTEYSSRSAGASSSVSSSK